MHYSAVQGNFSDDNGHAVEPAIVHVCNRCMWYKDKSDGTIVTPLAE
jgi:hypothetical protein